MKTVAVGFVFLMGVSSAQAQTSQTASELFSALKDIPGLADLPVSSIRKTIADGEHSTSASVTLHGKSVKIVGFSIDNTPYAALVPDNFALTDVAPIPHGTPIDGVSFQDIAFVVAPTSKAKSNVPVSKFPEVLQTALNHVGTHVDVKVGFNLFGEADFAASGAVKQVLSAIGHAKSTLPLNGAFPQDLFKTDPKKAGAALKKTLLGNLNLTLSLPQNFKIAGMPNIVTVNSANMIVVGREVKGQPKIFAGVTGALDVKVNGKDEAFSFGMLAAQPGTAFNPQITGDLISTGNSTGTIHLPFFQPLDLTSVHLVATKKNGAWGTVVNATASLNSKSVAVAVTHDKASGTTAKVTGTVKLADVLPSGSSIPGVTDVEFDEMDVSKDVLEVQGKVKNIETVVTVFKHAGKKYLAINSPDPLTFSDIIPQIGTTPLDSVSLKNMNFIWAPNGGAVTNLGLSDLPSDVEAQVKPVVSKLNLKAGINVIGQLAIEQSSDLGKTLNAVGAYKSSFPLVGQLSSGIFKKAKGNATEIKNEILDNLDISIPVPVNIPGIPHGVKIQNANLEIKGVNDKGNRSLDVDVAGLLDVTAGSSKADFNFDVKRVQKNGKHFVQFDAQEVQNTKFSVNMVETFKFSNMTFHMDNSGTQGWTGYISADTNLGTTPLSIAYFTATDHQPRHINIDPTGLTVGKLVGMSDLPGLDDIKLLSAQIYPGQWVFYANVKGVNSYIYAEKAPNNAGHFVSVYFENFSPAGFIPNAENTPLKDVSFEGLTMVYSPLKKATKLEQSGLDATTAGLIKKTSTNPVLKNGMNVFGNIDFSGAEKLKSLLSEVGVTKLKLPLKGTISPKSLSGQAASLKNAIWDSLDINVPLDVNIPGLPGEVSVQNANLEIKGIKDKSGARGIEATVAGELDAKVHTETVKMDFSLDFKKSSGQKADVTLSAKSTETKPVTLDLVESFDLTDIALDMTKSAGKWEGDVSASTTLNTKQVDVTYSRYAGKEPALTFHTDMTIADLIGEKNLPGLDDVALETIMSRPGMWFLKTKIKTKETYFQIQKIGQKHLIAAYLSDLNLSELIPDSSGTPLDDVDFSNVVALYNPGTTQAKVSSIGLKYDANNWVYQSNKNDPMVKPGLNIFGYMNVKTSGKMKTLLSDVGVKKVALPLNGGFSPKAFSKNINSQQIKNELLSNLDLKVNLPAIAVPGLGNHVTFANERLEIKGTLPDKSLGLSVKVAADSTIKLKSETLVFGTEIDYDRSQGAAKTDMEIIGSTDKAWNQPFGISFLDLDSVSLDIKKQTSNGARSYAVDISAKTTIGPKTNKPLDVGVDVVEENGTVSDVLFTLDGPVALSDIPGIKDIPEVNDLSVTSITASEHGFDASLTFNKKPTNLYAFEYENKWVVALEQNNFTLTEIVPPLKDTPLKHIQLAEAAIVLTQQQVTGKLSDFGPIGQDAFKTIYGSGKDSEVKLDQGLNLVAAFKHSKATGGMADGFKRMGMNQNRVVLVGSIGGIMGNTNPHVDLSVILDSHGRPSYMPKWMKFADNIDFLFSIMATESGEDFDVEVGVAMDVTTQIKDDLLTFEGMLALEVEEEKMDAKFVMDLKNGNVKDGGNKDYGLSCSLTKSPNHKMPTGPVGWHDPFGIPGFTLYNLSMDLGPTDDGIHFGYAGGAKVGEDRFCVAMDADLNAAELGLPQDVAFIGAADKVDMEFPENLAIQMATDLSKKAHLGISAKDIEAISILMDGLPAPVYKNVMFAFVTPGATDQNLQIVGEGVALKGDLWWLNKELGTIDMAVTKSTGIKVDATIGDAKGNLDVGPLTIKNTRLDFEVPMPPKDPLNGYFKVHGDVDIDYLDLQETIAADVTNKTMSFSVSNKLSNDFSDTITMALTGVDLSLTHPPHLKDADFSMSGDVVLDAGDFIGHYIGGPVTSANDTIFNKLDAAFKTAETKLSDAQTKVDDLTTKIKTKRADIRKKRAAAEKKVKNAQARVDALNSDIDSDWKSYHKCHGFFKWTCEAKYGLKIAILKAVVAIADEALKMVEGLIDHFPIDLDPAVAILIAERDVADAALTVAEIAVEGADVIGDVEKKVVKAITNELKNSVNIHKAGFAADFKKMVDSGAPAIFSLDAEIFGGNIKATLPFYLDPTKDAENVANFAIVGFKSLWHLIDNKLGSFVPSGLMDKIQDAVSGRSIAATNNLTTALNDYKAKYGAFPVNHDATTKAIAAQGKATIDKAHQTAVLDQNPLDHRTAMSFTNEFIEAGHTGLCLDSDGGKVKQNECTDGKASRWSVVAIKGDTNNYQHITVADSGNCIVPNGTWKTVKKTYTDTQGSISQSFTMNVDEFTGDGTLKIAKCGNSDEYKWKVVEHDTDGWLQFGNKATSKCLHFNNGNALPGKAEAEWEPCVGSANQVYRVADKLTPVYHKVGFAMRNDQLGLCVGEAAKDKTVSFGDCAKAAHYDYMVNIDGDVKMINTSTGHCLQPSGYKIGANMIEVPCTQLDYQWWEVTDYPGGFLIKNAQTKQCTQPPFGSDRHPKQVDCKDRHNSLFTAVTNTNNGPHWHVGFTPGMNINMPGTYSFNGKDLNIVNGKVQKTPSYICATQLNGGELVSGTTHAWSGATSCNAGAAKWVGGTYKPFNVAATSFSMVKEAPATTWVANTGKKLPENAIATGGLGTAITYTCRGQANHRQTNAIGQTETFPITIVGWTTDGKTCNYGRMRNGDIKLDQLENFEIFARSNKIFRFDISTGVVTSGPKVNPKPATPIEKVIKTAPVWIVGLGNAPYAWDAQNYTWIKQKGCLKQISVASDGVPVGIQCDDYAVTWSNGNWIHLGVKKGRDIGSGANGATWMVDLSGNPWKWTASGWQAHQGCLNRIDVMGNGLPVGMGCDSGAYYLQGETWHALEGWKGWDIGTGGAVNTWFIGENKHGFEWDGHWNDKEGCLARIDVAGNGLPWAVGCKGGVWAKNSKGAGWVQMPGGGVLDIGMKP